MSTRLRYANSITGKLLRGPANALLLMLALGTAAALHAQSADQIPRGAPPQSQVGTYSPFYSFKCTPDGEGPTSGLIRDASGNLYGTTFVGGQYGYGTVFKVTTSGTETVLHSFAGPPSDGSYPEFGSLTLDAGGNIYGTTFSGGEFGSGTVYRLTATGTEAVLYSFCSQYGCTDGVGPLGGIIRDSAGGVYGTAIYGGTYEDGVVFKLTPGGAESVLYSFGSFPTDGFYPTGNLTRDSSGNLYGTTEYGGASSGAGTVFEVTASGSESLLYNFNGGDGENPYPGGLLRNPSGNLYGVTLYGGNGGRRPGAGVVFELTPGGTESVLLDFNGTTGGKSPMDGLTMDAAGNVYGTTYGGGSGAGCEQSLSGCGVLFELTTSGKEFVLHNFALSSSSDGAYPQGGVVRDPSGNLYGTLSQGGAYGCGAVFKYTP